MERFCMYLKYSNKKSRHLALNSVLELDWFHRVTWFKQFFLIVTMTKLNFQETLKIASNIETMDLTVMKTYYLILKFSNHKYNDNIQDNIQANMQTKHA